MCEFANVSVVKKANIYFDGKVTSRTINFADGSVKTLGILMPGEYHFGTGKKEIMEITDGTGAYQLPGSTVWQEYRAGDSFEVPANAAFDIKVTTLTDYCCSYLE